MLQKRTLQATAISLLLVLPWLNPFAAGPSPAVLPLLFSWICVAALLLIRTNFDADAVARAWLLAGLISSVFGLCQYIGVAVWFDPWVNQTRIGEAYANLRQRNQFATLTVLALAALLWRARQDLLSYSKSSALADVGAAVVLGAGNAASSSRTGVVQLVLVCLLVWIWGGWRHKRVRFVLISTLVAYFVFAASLPFLMGLTPATHGILARLAEGDSICSSRITLWGNVVDLIRERPWVGWGAGELDYAHYITLYSGNRFCDILDNAHNLPLHVAVEFGVPVATVLFGTILWFVVRARPWQEVDAQRQMAWTVLAVIALHSMLEYPLWYGPFQMACGLCLWLLWPKRAASMRDGLGSSRGCLFVVQVGIGVILLAASCYVAWDYRRISQIFRAPEDRSPAYQTDTLAKIRDSWLFHRQVQFAELTTTPLTLNNAAHIHRMAEDLLHFSPEPKVIEKLIESAVVLGRDEEVRLHIARYRVAFPVAHAKWAAEFAKVR
jgi:O-antigen ligase